MRAAAKRGHPDVGSVLVRVKDELGVQLTAAEVVLLADETCTLRGVRKPHASQLKIAGQRGASTKNPTGALLGGLVRCKGCGCAMSPSSASKPKLIYQLR